MPRGEPLSPELVMVAPPDEAQRARAALAEHAAEQPLLEQAPQAAEERAEQVRRAWERLGERRAEQVEQAWEQVAVRAAEQLAREREQIAVRATELAQWDAIELDDGAEPVEAAVEDVAPTEQLGEPSDERPMLEQAPVEDDTEEPVSDWDAFLAQARAIPVEPDAVEYAPEVSPPRKRSRRTAALVALAVLALALFVGAAWARDWFGQSDPTAPSASAPPIQAPRQPTTSSSAPAKPKATPKKKKRTQKPAASKRPRAAARTASKAPKKSAAFVPARVWSWPTARGSSRYRVRFFRNGRKVLDVRTTKPRLVLARGFEFQNGRYRWTVVPISRAGKSLRPIVDSTFVVSGQ